MTYKEIENKIVELDLSLEAISCLDHPGYYEPEYDNSNEEDDSNLLQEFLTFVGGVKLVHEEGDCEGGGDHSEIVFHFTDHDVYLQLTGYYSSYNGTDWDTYQEVFPEEKTITVYNPKN